MKAARALLGIDQRELPELCDVSLPTIQRMEGSTGTVRGTIDSLVKIVDALNKAGIELKHVRRCWSRCASERRVGKCACSAKSQRR
jgi:predicted transcriptional regulator